MKRFIKRFFEDLFDFFFPNLCLCCKKKLRKDERYLCMNCALRMGGAGHIVQEKELAFKGRVPIEHLYARYKYGKGSAIQEIIHRFKYYNDPELARYMGERMGEWLLSYVENPHFDGIIPIPLHPLKQEQRGYNQSEKLAEGIGELLQIPVRTDVLFRRVYTHTQTTLEYSDRYENVKDIFVLGNTEGLSGKHFLLVDDVFTSGSTLEVASRELLSVKDLRLSVLVLAIA